MKTKNKKLLIRYLRSLGLQQKDIADILGDKNHQNIGYHLRTMRSAFLDKEESQQSNGAGVVSPLVGLLSDPPPPIDAEHYPAHTCIHYVQSAAYAQMEDLNKAEKITVLLALLAEVEAE
tara:strand:+ start:607 stop:966 length:360 start_codon:yes stop_codon:yes gene_type:complete